MLCHVFWSQVEYKIVCFILFGLIMHQSIPSTNIPPGQTPREFFKVVKFSALGQKIFPKLWPRGKKIDKNPAPGDNFVDL